VWLRPRPGCTLDVALRTAAGPEDALARAFALASPADVDTVWVDGEPVGGDHPHPAAAPAVAAVPSPRR